MSKDASQENRSFGKILWTLVRRQRPKKIFPDAFGVSSPPLAESMLSLSYDTGQSYRVMAWIARLLGISFFVSMLLNMGLSFLCFCLFPLKEVQPYVLALKEKGEQVVHIEPIVKNVKGLAKLTEALCRHYVSLRETLDGISEDKRWKELFFFCSQEIWADFYGQMNPQQPDSPLKKHREKKATRAVIIAVSSQVSEDVYQVEWQSITVQQGQEVERQRWVSTLQVELRPNAVEKEAEFTNPIGFTVVKYSISKREEEK